MKKKLLTLLLSLAMVMTMIPFTSITAFAGTFLTVGEILATVEFPTAENWGGKCLIMHGVMIRKLHYI